VMVEDVARTVHIGRQLGTLDRLDGRDVTQLFDRYQNVYGQTPADLQER
jgi:L-ribulose-5-phosphate 4-epimerase